ncbi:MAG: hypothetical protein KGL73_15130, partial [Burkholderiales bacterium]|nr:hypothetical protein [Burkholderiales bacterium]
MPSTAQFAFGAALAGGGAVLFHYFYGLIKTPEKTALGLNTVGRLTWGERLYLGAVVLTWMTLAYSGAYGLLSYVARDLAEIVGASVALGSLALLQHF